MYTWHLQRVNVASQSCLWLEGLLLTLVHIQLEWHIACEESQGSLVACLWLKGLLLDSLHHHLACEHSQGRTPAF